MNSLSQGIIGKSVERGEDTVARQDHVEAPSVELRQLPARNHPLFISIFRSAGSTISAVSRGACPLHP